MKLCCFIFRRSKRRSLGFHFRGGPFVQHTHAGPPTPGFHFTDAIGLIDYSASIGGRNLFACLGRLDHPLFPSAFRASVHIPQRTWLRGFRRFQFAI